jgi:Protein of unknown function (DUF3177)
MLELAFGSSAPLSLRAKRPHATSSRCAASLAASPHRRPRAALQPPREELPPEVEALNACEAARRMRLDASDAVRGGPAPRLTKEELEGLFTNFPELRERAARVDVKLRNVDTDNPDAFTWVWRRWRPWAPSYLLISAMTLAAYSLLRKMAMVVRTRTTPQTLALVVMRVDLFTGIALFGVLGPLLLLWTMVRHSGYSDAPRRLALTTTFSSLMLPATSALVASGYITTGFVLGAVVRLAAIPLSLWMWSDLSSEVLAMRAMHQQPIAYAFSIWRAVATAVLFIGGCLRVLALKAPDYEFLPIGNILADSALRMRFQLAARFPVSLSLMSDPGGLAFLAALIIFIGLSNMIYATVFVSDMFSQRMHRETNSAVAMFLIARGIYLPNVLRDRESLLSTSAAGQAPYFPMPAMMLKFDETTRGIGVGGVATPPVPRILQLLAEEEDVMTKKGMPRWMPPRSEFVPLSPTMSKLRRSQDFLRNWARPLDEDDNAQSFADFFESIDDENEYVYDPTTEDWVFANDMKVIEPLPEDIPSDGQTVGQIWSAVGKAAAGLSDDDEAKSDEGDGRTPRLKISFEDSVVAPNVNLNDPEAGTLT